MATRIFDLYIMEGDSFLFRAGLGLLRYWKNREEMLERDFEECLKQLNHHYSPTEEIEEEDLFQEIYLIPLTPKHYKELLDEGEQRESIPSSTRAYPVVCAASCGAPYEGLRTRSLTVA